MTIARNAACCLLSLATVVIAACGGGSGGTGFSFAGGGGPGGGGSVSGPAPQINVLSSDASRVTGESALVSIKSDTAPIVALNGTDISADFARDSGGGVHRALVKGLEVGDNTLVAKANGKETTQTLTDFPISGPVFSGPQQTPFYCETSTFALPDGTLLGMPTDANCSVPTKVTYIYKTTSGAFQPYDPKAAKPADLARTTTSEGNTLDYIVRVETGVINRGIYQIAFLHKPDSALPTPDTRTPGWNGGLVYGFGGGCGAAYRQGRTTGFAPWAFVDGGGDAIDLGYAVATSTLTVLGNSCNDVLNAETAMMVKEYFVKQFGVPRSTIGVGGSGGSMQQHLFAQNYPGILDGLLPGRSFADTLTVLHYASDCPLMNNYFGTTGLPWTAGQKTAVSGFAMYEECSTAWLNYLPRWVSPDPSGCDPVVPRGVLYDPRSNPDGTRCGYFDNQVNVWGKKASGAPRRPLDNVGVQYGLSAFNSGTISAEQFVDLNERIGGFDDDAKIVAARTLGDPDALQIAYRTGRVNEGVGLDSIPIIDTRSYADPNTPADVHTFHSTFKMRARLKKNNGNFDNQVMWIVPSTGSLGTDLSDATSPLRRLHKLALTTMDQWLANIAKDTSADSASVKVLRNKPAQATDGCFDATLQKTSEQLVYGSSGTCMTRFPPHGDPKVAAGEPIAGDILKCALKPLDRSAYGQAFSDPQWARMSALYAGGVCDYSKTGVGQQKMTSAWQKF
jgi:hypothetical protein